MERPQGHSEKRIPEGLLKRYLAPILVLIAIVFLAQGTNATTKLSTIYHVYLDNTYIGIASDKKAVEESVEKILNKEKKQYNQYELELGNQLTYIPEQVFRSNADHSAVNKKIAELAQVKAVSTAITVDGAAIVHLKDETEAEVALNKFKLNFTSEEELKAFEAKNHTGTTVASLEEAQDHVLDIRIKEDALLKETPVQPDQILSVEEAVQLLEKGTLEEKKYQVKSGDVLGKIAAAHQMGMEQLLQLNEGLTEDSVLQIGQELNIVATNPLLHVIVEREIHIEEVVAYEKEVVEDSTMPKGDTKVKQEGKNGKSSFIYKITEQNGKQLSKEVISEQVIESPIKHIVLKGTKVIPSRGTGSFVWPASGGYVSSKLGQRWGRLHKGIDIARPSNYTIKAADHGIVVSAGWDNSGYGNKIVIDHQNGFKTVYAHLKSMSVSTGQRVEQGSSIGIMGSTGNSTGTHLHFEMYKNGSLQNPLNYF